MVRILFETSLPAHTLEDVKAGLAAEARAPGLAARIELLGDAAGCERPALGGAASWTPCWISLEAQDAQRPLLASALAPIKDLVVRACREAGLELYAIAATAEIGGGFYRFRDLLDVAGRLGVEEEAGR